MRESSFDSSVGDEVPTLEKRAAWWLPYAILILAALFLLLKWDSIPDRWVIHWNARGEPNGWSARDPVGVFFPLALGLFMCGVFELVKWFAVRVTLRRTATALSVEAARAFAGMTRDLLLVIQTGLALVCSVTALMLPLAQPERPGPFVGAVLLILPVAIIIGISRWVKSARALERNGLLDGVEGWNGVIYRNQTDPRLWVPKIVGPGYTLNFARREAWLILVGILLLPLVAVAFIFFLTR